MKSLKQMFGGTLALACILGLSAPSAQAADVVDTAAGVPDLSTLVSLVQAAELDDALKDADDITVFAPTNAAFDNLPERINRAIEIEPSILTTILLYHVAPERLRAADVVATRNIDTLANDALRVRTAGDKVFVDRSEIIAVDIETDNATVHLIDRVLLPWHLIRDDVRNANKEYRDMKRAERKAEKAEKKGNMGSYGNDDKDEERVDVPEQHSTAPSYAQTREYVQDKFNKRFEELTKHFEERVNSWSSHSDRWNR